MTKLIPKWLFTAYSKLWLIHKDQPFTFSEAMKELSITEQKVLSNMFTKMRRADWITSKRDPDSARRRIFKLRKITTIFKELLEEYSK